MWYLGDMDTEKAVRNGPGGQEALGVEIGRSMKKSRKGKKNNAAAGGGGVKKFSRGEGVATRKVC